MSSGNCGTTKGAFYEIVTSDSASAQLKSGLAQCGFVSSCRGTVVGEAKHHLDNKNVEVTRKNTAKTTTSYARNIFKHRKPKGKGM